MNTAHAVPVFTLYGDGLGWPTPDLLHWESIAARSRRHDWHIAPHRHADLVQLLYLSEGWAEVEIEGASTRLTRAAVQVVPALSIHGFRFCEQVQGHVLTLAAPLVASLADQLGPSLPVFDRPDLHPAGADKAWLDQLFAMFAHEYANPAPARDLQLRSLTGQLAVWLGRQALARRGERPLARGDAHFQAFTRLVEAYFREQMTVEQYAHRLGITPAYLNGLTRRLAGQSAQALVHRRVLLEAQRLLIYSALTVAQIAEVLGFSEPAYFSRFFKRLAGQTPGAFRRQR
ncbi:helix-turn-helix domain-containing protein [Stutzerimonas urumqiensis]|uniref:helix-turn-helix domain-containing protein n=1 Tax=Stutzerimonas urumqiensis TaxID=638269 RepID=UPI003BA8DEBB